MPTPADLWNYKIPGSNYTAAELLLGTNVAAWGAKIGAEKIDVAKLTATIATAIKGDASIPANGVDADAIAQKVVEVLGATLAAK